MGNPRRCPITGCTARATRAAILCRDHWFRGPGRLREEISRCLARWELNWDEWGAKRYRFALRKMVLEVERLEERA